MYVLSVAVTSIDGYLTRHDGAGTSTWASPEDQTHFRAMLRSCDVSVMGGETYRAGAEAIRASVAAAVAAGTVVHRRVVWTRDSARYAGDSVAGALEFTSAPLPQVVAQLKSDGHRRCAVVGGGQVYGELLAADLVDEISLTIEPRLFGSGVRHSGEGFVMDRIFTLRSVERLNADTVLLTYLRS